MIRLTRRRLFVLAACGLLIWVSFSALAAANTVEPSSASETVSAFDPQPPVDPIGCDGYSGKNLVIGTSSGETLSGGNGADCVAGLGGNDTIFGGNGSDRLLGGDGNDTIFGGSGSDVIDGGPGFDTCFGGLGNDSFVNCEVWFEV